jgi:glycosyltransferase involved in cell wall biosynthesis
VFVLPSRFEGNPKALLEAMACGLPVIGTNVQGIRDIIRHQFNGILVDSGVESLAEAIEMLLTKPELAHKLGNQAARDIADRYTFDEIVRLELQTLQETIHA